MTIRVAILSLAAVCLLSGPSRAKGNGHEGDECGEDRDGEHEPKSCKCRLQAALAELAAVRAQLAATSAVLGQCQSDLSAASQALSTCNSSLSTCNSSLSTCNGLLSTCNGSLQSCGGSLQSCHQDLSACEATLATATLPKSCAEIHAKDSSLGDGVYAIQPSGSPALQVRCLMSADGGGWTQVGNFVPVTGSTSGVPGWTSGSPVGAGFTDLASAWKMSDALINQLRTAAYRVHGSATECLVPGVGDPAPCAVNTTLFYGAACTYNSGARNAHCGEAYFDAALSQPLGLGYSDSSPCPWHWGLSASVCGTLGGMGTSHSGDHVFAGHVADFIHAFDGRGGENPLVQFWVR